MLVNSQDELCVQEVNEEEVIIVNKGIAFIDVFIGILLFILLLIAAVFYQVLSLLMESIVNSFSSEV
ncbi:MAG: hypothetical protein N2169_03415 [bacterium]|nr:hypothetical protein [bacterium]